MQFDRKQCITYVDESILNNFMCSHEESTEHFINKFTSLSSEDKEKLSNNFLNKDDCKSYLKGDFYCYQSTSQIHDNKKLEIQEHIREKCSYNTNNSENSDSKVVTDNYLEVENWNNNVEVDTYIREIEPVDITSEYGKEVHTGGIINCMTCNTMDVAPTYDNYLGNDQHILPEYTTNEKEELVLMKLVQSIPCSDDENSQCNTACSTETLLKAITEALEFDEGIGDENNQLKIVDVVVHNNRTDEQERSIDDYKEISVITNENEEVHKELEVEENESIVSNNSITLPGVDNTSEENFCTESLHNIISDNNDQHDKDNVDDIERKTKNKNSIDVHENSILIAELQSIINENDDCVHPFQACSQYETTQLNEAELCSNATRSAEDVERQNAYNATNTSIDVLGRALRYHSYVERMESQEQLTKNM